MRTPRRASSSASDRPSPRPAPVTSATFPSRPATLFPLVTDELVEHVDEAGNVLAVVTRERMRAERLRHRCVYLLVTHAGHLLIHRRADHKDIWPDRWDVAAGGVVGADESWDD